MIKFNNIRAVGYLTLLALLFSVTAASAAAKIESAKPTLVIGRYAIEHILSTGQSNSVGSGLGSNVLTSASLFNTSYGLQLHKPQIITRLIEPNVGIELIKGETHQSGMINTIEHLRQLRGDKPVNIFASSHGLNATAFTGIASGSNSYNDLLAAVKYGKSYADSLGLPYSVPAVVIIHGEADALFNTGYTYQQKLEEFQKSLDKDIRSITKQKNSIKLFVQQLLGDSALQLKIPFERRMQISTAQIKAMLNSQGNIIVTSPSYFLPVANNANGGALHSTAKGYRWMGEYLGKAIDATIHNGSPFHPLLPTAAKINGNDVVIDFHSPVGALQWDENNKTLNKGFSFESKTHRIKSVKFTGPKQVTITAASQLPNDLVISYAGASTYSTEYPKGGGAIIDSDTTKSLFGNDLHNHCLRFRIQINNKKEMTFI